MKQTFKFNQFASAVGFNDSMTQEASLVFHNEYVKADEPKQAKMRTDWILNYLQGNLATRNPDQTLKALLPESKAQAIMDTPRTERTKQHQRAYDRARHQFTYHVVRPESTTSKQGDLVAQALALYAKMSGAQKRSFKARLPK